MSLSFKDFIFQLSILTFKTFIFADDCKNIANILKELAKKGVVFHKTGSV